MKEYVFRLTKGQKLKEEILNICNKNNIQAGYVACSVGSISHLEVRDAGGKNIHTIKEDMEIISLNGTISKNRVHLHISCSKEDLSIIGGHLVDATINTTCELIIVELENYCFNKIYDENTGYNELNIIKWWINI